MGLGACSTRVPAPVDDRTSTPATAPAEASPGHYIVKQGDTLHRIAQDHGVTFRDLAEWNQLDDPNRLEVGREIRVVPPGGATVTPIDTQSPVEVAPAATDAPQPVPAPPDVKTGPLGGVIPYSDEAWQAARAEAGLVATPEVPAAAPPAATPAPVPSGIKRVDGIDWSWPTGGKVVSQFSDTSDRKGLDITGNTGDPVLAAAAGKVVYEGTGLRGYGKLVIIKHDSNYLSAYAHNDQLMVAQGQSVSRGQQIATLGSTDSDRPKLHFEIRRRGKPVDPFKYLPAR